jgi:protease-4
VDPHNPSQDRSEPILAAEVVGRPAPPPRPRRSRFLPLLLIFVLLALGGSILLNLLLIAGKGSEGAHVQEKIYRPDQFGRGSEKVAIISVEGVILEGDGFARRQIDQAKRDDNVKAIVLRVNSPGGTISGSDYIYHELMKLREETHKPIIVSMGALAASGGYYVSMAVGDTPNTIYAEPSTWTGSIGVIMPHYDLSKLLGDIGIAEDPIVSHRLKGMGSFAKPMTEEERKIFQDLINDGFARFKTIVQSGRPYFKEHPEKLDEVATGQVFSAEQAKTHGLVDQIGFLDDAVGRAVELGKVDRKNYRVVKYEPEPTLSQILFGQEVRQRGFDPSALLDLATPRAYYLFTWPPAVLSGHES